MKSYIVLNFKILVKRICNEFSNISSYLLKFNKSKYSKSLCIKYTYFCSSANVNELVPKCPKRFPGDYEGYIRIGFKIVRYDKYI